MTQNMPLFKKKMLLLMKGGRKKGQDGDQKGMKSQEGAIFLR